MERLIKLLFDDAIKISLPGLLAIVLTIAIPAVAFAIVLFRVVAQVRASKLVPARVPRRPGPRRRKR
jgi:hypothetical protein